MTNERITIQAHEDKTSKNGKDYTRFDTNLGWMSCFESDVNKELKLLPEGHSIEVDFKESEWQGKKQYAIQSCFPKSATDTPALKTETESPKEVRKSVKGTAYEKDPVGLAIEVFSHRQDIKTIVEAVEIVKATQAMFN